MEAIVDLNSGSGFIYGAPSAVCDVGVRINAHVDAALEAAHRRSRHATRRQPDPSLVRSSLRDARIHRRGHGLRVDCCGSSMPATSSGPRSGGCRRLVRPAPVAGTVVSSASAAGGRSAAHRWRHRRRSRGRPQVAGAVRAQGAEPEVLDRPGEASPPVRSIYFGASCTWPTWSSRSPCSRR